MTWLFIFQEQETASEQTEPVEHEEKTADPGGS